MDKCILCKPGTEGEHGTRESCGEYACVCAKHYCDARRREEEAIRARRSWMLLGGLIVLATALWFDALSQLAQVAR